MHYQPLESIVVLLVVCRLFALCWRGMILDPMPDLLAPRLLVRFLVIASKQEYLDIWCLSQTGDLMSSLTKSCVAMAIVCPREGDIERIDGA